MREQLIKIMSDYTAARHLGGSHPIRSFISTTTANEIRRYVDSQQYTVKGSSGTTNFAAIPWIAIFDKDITKTATYGFYVCYLFKADMSGVYLTLNQGWTHYEKTYSPRAEAEAQCNSVSIAWRNILVGIPDRLSLDSIQLADKGTLARGYEAGHICGRYYDVIDMPSDEVLIADLRAILGVYQELKGRMPVANDVGIANEEVLVSSKANEEISDVKYQTKIAAVDDPIYTPDEPQSKPNPRRSGARKTWTRDPRIARGALVKAGYRCEYDESHVTFMSKRTNYNYVEAHHLIPVSMQEDFEYSLDVTSNIVSLCPNCHGRIHHAVVSEKEEMLKVLYEKRKDQLRTNGLEIELAALLEMYR